MWGQLGCQKDRGRAIRSTDYSDRSGFHDVESQKDGTHEGGKDAKLGSRTQKNQARISNQRRKIRHCPYPKEYQRGINTFVHTKIEVVQHRTGIGNSQALFRNAGDVSHHDAKADGNQKQRLKLFADTQIDKYQPGNDHQQVAPGYV